MPLNRWWLDGASASNRETSPRLVPGGFEPLPHAGHEKSEADTHVESFGEYLRTRVRLPALHHYKVLIERNFRKQRCPLGLICTFARFR